MKIVIDTNSTDFLQIDDESCGFSYLDEKLMEIILKKNIDVNEYSIANKYLRAIVRKKGFEYHVLEKSCGITSIYCQSSNGGRKELKFDLPYTVMILKLKYLNGEYTVMGDRLFHTNVPVKKDLSNSLWRWSLSNVYPANNICWGSERLPKVDTQTTHKLITEFFLATKNYDLLTNKEINWKVMNKDTIYKIDIKHLNKQPLNIKEVISSNF